ncbi:MAG TPA: MATE family efflux transporter [Cyclobacteriaceae bacterium]|nr:MATE family efflux transporter [Cyclobacteriaceae bacterium]
MFKDDLIHVKKSFLIAYPVMLSQLGQVSVGIADSIMVGRIGKEPLAGASLGNSIFVIFLTFGIGVAYGITPLVAQADGEGNHRRIINILKHGVLVNSLAAVALLSILIPINFMLGHFNQPEEVVVLTRPYLLIISLSIIPFMFFQSFKQFTEGLSFTRQSMTVTIIGNLINIALNYILIYGKLGFPSLGLTGAGIATFISRFYMAFAMGGYVYFGMRFKVYRQYFKFGGYDRRLVRQILSIGLPSGMQFVFEVGAFSMAAIMMGWLGTVSLAAHQIAINLSALTYMMATGIATATTIRVGNQYGRNDIPLMRRMGFIGFSMGGLFMSFNAIIMIIFREKLPALYIGDPEVIRMASSLILVAALFQISDGIQVVGLGALRGMSDVRIPTLFTLIAYWILALPIGYITGILLNMGPLGIWWGLWGGLTTAAVLLLWRFNRISKKQDGIS